MANSNDELVLLEKVFLKVGLADTDEQLEEAVSKFLPPVLLKLSSPNERVRQKVMEFLSHINKRVKHRNSIQLPVESLLVQYQDPSASSSAFIVNFTIIYIKLGYPRLPSEKQIELIPSLVHAAEGKPKEHQESLLYLMISALHHSPQNKDKLATLAHNALKEKPKLLALFLDILLDILLFPYGWSKEEHPPEISEASFQRIGIEVPLTNTAETLEPLKMTIMKLITSGVFDDNQVFCHLVVSSGDSRNSITTVAESQLRRISPSIDFSSQLLAMRLYSLYIGDPGGDPKKRGPASVRLRLKLLQQMAKFKVIIWPTAMQVLFDSLYGENTNNRLKQYAMTFCASMIAYCRVEQIKQVGPILLNAGLIKLIRESPTDNMIRRQAFSVLGQLVVKLPGLADVPLLALMFQALQQEVDYDVQSTVRDSMIMMAKSYSLILTDSPQVTTELMDLLMSKMDSEAPKCRAVATQYLSSALPVSNTILYCLVKAAVHPDEEVNREAKKALYGAGVKAKPDNLDTVLPLPDFQTMLGTTLERLTLDKENGKDPSQAFIIQLVDYLRLCIAHSAGCSESPWQYLVHPCKQSVIITRYLTNLHSSAPHLLSNYVGLIAPLLKATQSKVLLAATVELVGCLPQVFTQQFSSFIDTFMTGLGHAHEEVRELNAQLVGLVSGSSADSLSTTLVNELKSGGKDLEKLHGSLLALGNVVERSARRNPNQLPLQEDHIKLVGELLNHKHSLVVGGACECISLMSQSTGLPASAEVKKSLVDNLMTIVLTNKHPSKVRDRACSALASLCVGENEFPCKKDIIDRLVGSAREVKDVELVLAAGESIVAAILGASSPLHQDLWVLSQIGSSPDTEALATHALTSLFSLVSNPHPSSRQCVCFWLLAITKHCVHLESIKTRLDTIQAAFMELLSESSSVVQEAAGKGLSLVYLATNDDRVRSELVSKVVEQLTSGKRTVSIVNEDTKLFHDGELGSAPTGGNLTTYRELCSLASDLNQPDLIYKFMHLANHNAVWNSKKGAAFGVSSIAETAGQDQIEKFLPKIIAKLYRYQYDPTPSVQQTMASIWSSLTSQTTNAVEKYRHEIWDDLVVNLTAPQWRVRFSSCQAVSDFIRGGGAKVFIESPDKVPELWKQLFRVMDDIHEATREAATATTKQLAKICVRECDKSLGKAASQMSDKVLGVLLEDGIKSSVAEVRSISVSAISELVKGGVGDKEVGRLVPALLQAAGELESRSLNHLSVMVSGSAENQEAIDSLRASAVKSHFTVQTLSRLVPIVTVGMLDELTPQLVDLLKSSVGLGSRIATAHFLVLLSHHLQCHEIQPYIGKFLAALLHGLSDRNGAVRRNYATTIGQLIRCAKDSSVDRLLTKLSELYFEKEEEGPRNAVCHTLQAMCSHSQDTIKARPELVLPLAFFAKHQVKKEDGSNKSILDTWDEIWEDLSGGNAGAIRNLDTICRLLEQTMSSPSWHNKAQAARSIQTLGNKLKDGIPDDKRAVLMEIVVKGLSGRTWDGKEALLHALAALSKQSNIKGTEMEGIVIKAMMTECGREKINYRIEALGSLGDILEALEVDRYQDVYTMVTALLHQADEKKKDDDVDESLSRRQDDERLQEIAIQTLGKAWPRDSSTQENYLELVIRECVTRLDRSTRPLQSCLMSTIVSIIDRTLLLKQSTSSLTPQQTLILNNVYELLHQALNYSFVIPKHTKLRKEALNLLHSLFKMSKDINPTEYQQLKDIFLTYSDKLGEDRAPEIKSRFIDIKENFISK